MQLKDYYKTLELQPNASMLQIKKSFRQLALRHHPDKNPGSALAEAKFKEIQEAYEQLIDPQKREVYNYKRWYNRSIHESFTEELFTPASIVQESMRLNNYLRSVNTMGIDFDGLSNHIRQVLSNKNISLLQEAGDAAINARLVSNVLATAELLPFRYIEPITTLLLLIAGTDQALVARVQAFQLQQKQKNTWEKYKAGLVVLATLLLCWIIYRLSA